MLVLLGWLGLKARYLYIWDAMLSESQWRNIASAFCSLSVWFQFVEDEELFVFHVNPQVRFDSRSGLLPQLNSTYCYPNDIWGPFGNLTKNAFYSFLASKNQQNEKMMFGYTECILRIAPNFTFWQHFLTLKIVVPKKQRMNPLGSGAQDLMSKLITLTPHIHIKGKASNKKRIWITILLK